MRTTLHVAGFLLLCGFPVLTVDAQDQQPPPPPNEKLLPHEAVGLLLDDVDALRLQGALTKPQHRFFDKVLTKAQLALYSADPVEALDGLDDFLDKTADLVESGKLAPQQGAPLIGLGTAAVQGIDILITPLPRPEWPLVCIDAPPPPPPGEIPTLHVASDAEEGGDGSAADPFRTITAALDHAEDLGLAAVNISLDDLGPFEEHIEITRHTRIVGVNAVFTVSLLRGSITSTGPYSLEVQDLAIEDPGSGPTGAVYVDHPCAATSLHNVFVLAPADFGVFQRAGIFSASNLVIDQTRPLSATVSVAMQLDGGVSAELENVFLSRSHGGGLLIAGPGTTVVAHFLQINDTEANPLALEEGDLLTNPGTTALDVRDDARFDGMWVEVDVSEYVGVHILNGAACDLLYSFVSRTRSIDVPGFEGGINVATLNATLHMNAFTISRADLCGIGLARDPVSVDLEHGRVSENAIGACVHPEGYDITRLTHDVDYVDNARDIESASFPEFDPLPPLP